MVCYDFILTENWQPPVTDILSSSLNPDNNSAELSISSSLCYSYKRLFTSHNRFSGSCEVEPTVDWAQNSNVALNDSSVSCWIKNNQMQELIKNWYIFSSNRNKYLQQAW